MLNLLKIKFDSIKELIILQILRKNIKEADSMKCKINKVVGLLVVFAIIIVSFAYAADHLDEEGKLKGKWSFYMKCGKCHNLLLPLNAKKSPDEWAVTLQIMHGKAHAWIDDKQIEEITTFLQYKSLFDEKCYACHKEDRAIDLVKDKKGWTETVKKMQGKKGASISAEDAEKIILYLYTTQGGG